MFARRAKDRLNQRAMAAQTAASAERNTRTHASNFQRNAPTARPAIIKTSKLTYVSHPLSGAAEREQRKLVQLLISLLW